MKKLVCLTTIVSFIIGFIFNLNVWSIEYKLPYPAGDRYEVTCGNFDDPVCGHITHPESKFAWDFSLPGWDDFGKPIVATASGTVHLFEDKNEDDGQGDPNYIVIKHDDSHYSLYLHIQQYSIPAPLKNTGVFVQQGQHIANIGNSGMSTAPHLHFQVQNSGASWWQQSIRITFSDPDVLAQDPDGIPKAGKWYTSSNTTSPQNKTLVHPSDGPYSDRVYWLQNNKLYWVTTQDIIDQMSSLPGWSHVNPHPQSELSGFEGWPDGVARFIDPSNPDSDGILIQYSPEAVFITENGKRRGFTHSEALTFYGGLLGYGFDDVIEVTKPVRDMFPEGDPICYPGQGAPNPQLFKDCYFRVVSYEGKSKYDLFGMAHTLADPWGDGLTQHFRKDSNELAMMKPDSKNVAYAIYGGIWAKYQALGNPPGFLGYPFSDEREADQSGAEGFNTQGRVQDFKHGILVFHRTGSRAGQTFEMHGEIYPTYIQNGASGGWLGFPISDVYNDPTTSHPRSDFEGGCITTLDGINYYAYGKLNADFSGTPREGDKPLTVNFTDLSSGKSTKWQWNFGDGGTSTQKNPSHTYQNAGYYTVTLTVSNPYDSDTETKTNYIYVTESCVSPVANFTGTPREGCASLTVNFTDQSTNNPTSWSWSFGDGGTSTQRNPSHTYTNPGAYTVSLTVTNSCGSDTETKTNYITVLPEPIADFVGTPTKGDAPLTVQFTDNSTGNPTSWSWGFGDGGTSTQRNPSHPYTNPGKYTVSLTVTNDCGSDTETKTDYIEVTEAGQSPVADFEGNPTQGCAPLTVQFTDQSTGEPTSWSWTFGDGGTSTAQNPSHTYNNPGKYTVSLTASNQFGSDTEEKADYITVLPKPTADFVAEPTSGFVLLTVQFTEQSTDNPTSWQWDFGDEGSSTEQHPSHTYTSSGTYTVSLTATNDCGSDTETKPNYIEVKPKEPDISVDPTSLDFGKVVVEDSKDKILTISNEGNADLEVTNITADKPDFSVSETTFTVPSDSSHEITVTFTPQAEGEITGNLTIESNDPDEETLPVPVAGVGVPYVNRALSLDGLGDYVDCGTDPSVLPDAWTVSAWVKPNDVPRNILLCFRNSASPTIALQWGETGKPMIYMSATNYMYFDASAWTILKDGNWHHVAFTLPGTADADINNAQMYLDGEAVFQSGYDNSGAQSAKSHLHIGKRGDDASFGNGCIDEVRIWNAALTQNQIQSTMHLRLTGNEPGLVGCWRLDEEPGTPIAHDSSPYGNDGTLFGDADFVEPGAPIARPTVEANILVYPTELDFGDVIVGRFEEQTLTVVNTGEQDLHVWDISSDSSDVTVTPNSFSLAMGQSQQVFVRYSPQTKGPLYAMLQIESDDPDEGIVEVVVIGQGVPYVNRALSLDGDGDYVEIPDTDDLSFGDGSSDSPFSISVWIYMDDASGFDIISKADEYRFLVTAAADKLALILEDDSASNATIGRSSDTVLTSYEGEWIHIVATYDGSGSASGIKLYLNGARIDDTSGESGSYVAMENTSSDVEIGFYSSAYADGKIDEVRIWNIARTKEEIRADMNQPIENPELLPNLVGYWNFDDGTADDSSLYGNHGTLMGDAEIVPLYGTWPRPLRGDVSGDGTISAYDAALILQYTVGLRDSFPAGMLASPDGIPPKDYILKLPELTANAGNRIQTPIFINDATGLMAGGITLKYNPTILKAVNVTSQTLFLNGAYNKANIDRQGEVRFAFATTQPMKGNGNLFTVEFDVLPNTTGEISPLFLDNVELSNSLSITKLDGSVTVLPSSSALLQNFPNPFNPETWIPYELAKEAEVVIKIYNIKGELVRALSIGHQPSELCQSDTNRRAATYRKKKPSFGMAKTGVVRLLRMDCIFTLSKRGNFRL